MKPFVALVDDEPEILSIFGEGLGDSYFISTFNSPESFLKDLERGYRPDAVVSDLKMSEMSGIELARQTKSQSHSIPFILISGYAGKSDVAEAINENLFFGFVDKPFPMSALLSLVDKAVQESQARAHARKRFEDLKAYIQAYSELERNQFDRVVLAENLIFERAPELFEDSEFRQTYLRLLKAERESQRQISILEAKGTFAIESSGRPGPKKKVIGE